MGVAPYWDCLEDFFEILLGCSDLLWVAWGHCVFNFHLQHHGEVLAVLVDFLVPVYHGLELALDTFYNAVSQKLVVISKQRRSLLRLHVKSSAKSVQDEFKGWLCLAWFFSNVHLHNVYTILHWFLLSWLEASSSTTCLVKVWNLVELSVILTIVSKIQNFCVTRNAFHVSLDSFEQPSNFLRITSDVQTLDVILNDNSNFLK